MYCKTHHKFLQNFPVVDVLQVAMCVSSQINERVTGEESFAMSSNSQVTREGSFAMSSNSQVTREGSFAMSLEECASSSLQSTTASERQDKNHRRSPLLSSTLNPSFFYHIVLVHLASRCGWL
jgi:hypothetical protein